MTPQQEQALLDATALGLDNDLRVAYRKLTELIGQGMAPRTAVAEVLKDFEGQYADLLAQGFSAILGRSVGSESVLALRIGAVTLSQHLYTQSREVSASVAGLIQRHAQGFHDVRKLTLDLYEGYGFRDREALNLSPRNTRLPKYLRQELLQDARIVGELRRHFARVQINTLKTPALKASYLQYVDGIEKGAGQALLDRRMQIAFHERMRYFANRIAQTELHRAYADRQGVELMDDADVDYVQVRMSGTHPKFDVCDMLSKVDRYGLGPGVYPKAKAPKPGFHPFCRCNLAPRLDLTGRKARENPHAEREWLRQQSITDGAAVMGSKERRVQALKGDPVGIYNARLDPAYRVATVGSVDGANWPLSMRPESVAKPSTAAELAARYPAPMTPERAAEQFIATITADRRTKQPPLVLDPVPARIAVALETLGAKPRERAIALDHDYTLHIIDSHGSAKERMRGQEPISAADFGSAGALLEGSSSLVPGTPTHSKNGAQRVEVQSESADFRYWIVFEVRKHHLVPYTMYKRKK